MQLHTHSLGLLPSLLSAGLLLASTAEAATLQIAQPGGSAAARQPRPQRPVNAPPVVDLRTVPLNQAIAFRSDRMPVPATPESSPFGEAETMLLRRAEVGVFMSSADGTSLGGSTFILDDTASGEGVLPGSASPDGMGRNIRDARAADIDRDGQDEIVVLSLDGPFLTVWQVDVEPEGGPITWSLLHEFPVLATNEFVTARLEIGDFDGDRRDEIAVFRTVGPPSFWVNSSTLWVLDDPVSGGGVLLEREFPTAGAFGAHARYFGVAADLDDDGDDELIVARQGESGSKGHVRFSMYNWNAGAFELVVDAQRVYTNPLPTGGAYMCSKAAAGQLDGDGAEEIALMSSSPITPNGPSDLMFHVDQIEYDVMAQQFVQVRRATFSGPCEASPIPEYSFDVATVDRFGDGKEWIALLRKPVSGPALVRCLRDNPGTGNWDSVLVSDTVPTVHDAVTLRAADADGDGVEELFAGFSWGSAENKFSWVERIEAGVEISSRTIGSGGLVTSSLVQPTQPLALAIGEFDGDGLRVEYQGTRLRASNPVPLTLLAAAPSKAGIEQNYSSTLTRYSVATGAGVETEYSTTTTLSAAAGFEVEDFTGTFGASVKATLDYESRTSNTVASTTTLVTGYEGGADADVIVFASNNYLVHSYRILDADDDDAVGKVFSIDVPLETRISKWTVPFYNAAVAPRYRMGSDLLPHTVGDPATYRTAFQMDQLVAPLVSWQTNGTLAVGEGLGGSVSMGIELASQNATTQQTEMAVGTEASFKAFGATVEASISAGFGAAYTVTTNRTTTFEGQLGDIAAADYADWAYAAGMTVYQAWRLADGSNNPTGAWLPGGYPLTVIDFWVDPFGASYQ